MLSSQSVPSSSTGRQVEDPLVDMIKDNINKMANNVTTVTKMVNSLGTAKDGPELRERMGGIIESSKLIARDTTNQLKELSAHTRGNANEQTKMVHQKLAKDFSVWLTRFQEVSKVAGQKERQNLPPQSKAQPNGKGQNGKRSPDFFPQSNDYDEEAAGGPLAEKQGLLESSRRQQLMQIEGEREFQDALIQDREEGIRQIEATVTEVNEIFTDLANIVHEQGFMIDNIESNIDSTVHQTQEGVNELRKASDNQKKARSKMCWLLLIVAIIAVVITVVLVLSIKL